MKAAAVSVEFPRAFAFAIDDMGWNEGSDLSGQTPSGPYRAGVKRPFDLSDYEPIVAVGQAVGVRVQSLFILSEMDRDNVLSHYPTTTYLKGQWDNRARVCEQQVEIMNYVRRSAAHLEFGCHGTGHEYWAEDGIQRRAEWYNLTDRRPWPEAALRGHLEAFRKILDQYGLGPDHGHSFPESFVPCGYSFYWNPGGNYSLGKLLAEAGVKYANTDFGQIPELSPPPEQNGGGFDHGVHVINRNNYGNPWYALSCLPNVTLDLQYTDIIESHWPNWLAQDQFLQPAITAQWIAYYRGVQRFKNRYIAKNTEQLHAQWLYHRYATVKLADGRVEIDNSLMPDEAYRHDKLGNLVLKIALQPGQTVSTATINGAPVPAYFEDEGFGFLYLPRLEKKKYVVEYTLGSAPLPLVVCNDGTYNVYDLRQEQGKVMVSLKVYGTQIVKIRCQHPKHVMSDNPALTIDKRIYQADTGMLHLQMTASDIQGSPAILSLLFPVE